MPTVAIWYVQGPYCTLCIEHMCIFYRTIRIRYAHVSYGTLRINYVRVLYCIFSIGCVQLSKASSNFVSDEPANIGSGNSTVWLK